MEKSTTLQVFTGAAIERLTRDNPGIIGATSVTFDLPEGWTAERFLAFLAISTMPSECESAFVKTGRVA
jgi:hypothetical protein